MSECAVNGFSGDLYLMQVIFSVVFATFLTYCIVTLAMFIYKRKRQPIVARPFRTTVAGFVFLMIWISELCFQYILREGHSCAWFLVFGWPLLVFTMTIYLSRVWMLWFKFKSTQEKSTLPPLRNVSFNLSSLKRIRTRMNTYTSRKMTGVVVMEDGSGANAKGGRSPAAGVGANDANVCRTTTVTFAPSAENSSSRASSSSGASGSTSTTLVDPKSTDEQQPIMVVRYPVASVTGTDAAPDVAGARKPTSGDFTTTSSSSSSDVSPLVADHESTALEGDTTTASMPAVAQGTLPSCEDDHPVAPSSSSPRSDGHRRPPMLRLPSHTRSDAVTLSRVELTKTLTSASAAQGDDVAASHADVTSVPVQIPPTSFSARSVSVEIPPTPSSAHSEVRSHDRGISRSCTLDQSSHLQSQFLTPKHGCSSVYVSISNDSTAEPSFTSTFSDDESDVPPTSSPPPLAPPRKSIFDDMTPQPTPKAGSMHMTASTPRASASGVGQTSIHWYLNHKHYGSDRFILKWFGLKALVEWLVLMAPMYTSGGAVFREELSDECFCPSLVWALYAFMGIAAYHAVIVGYAAWRFLQIKDGFYLKAEFKYISIIAFSGIVIWNLLSYVPGNDDVFPFTNLWMILVSVGIFAMSGSYPLWMSRKRGMRTRGSSYSVSSSRMSQAGSSGGCSSALYSFLTDTEGGLQEFAEHLQREFSIENLLFWQAVEQYHSEFSDEHPKANRELALEIESRFINDESDLQVNLNSKDYRFVHESIANDKITIDLFDASSSHIFRLMATDSFVRFRNQRKESLRGD